MLPLVGVALVAATTLVRCAIPPDWGANALLHPYKHMAAQNPRDVGLAEEDLTVAVDNGVELRGWLVRASGPHRGLILWLHGVADSRASGIGFAARYAKQGFDVAAFDARAHGESGGAYCTYGYYEKHDIPKLLDALAARGIDASRTVLMGMSMGAAVALQAAPDEPRVRGVIAMAPFSTLWLASYERKPYVMSDYTFRASVRRAEEIAQFKVDEVAPVEAVKRLQVPLLLIHGEQDEETPPAHSQRIYAAATTAKKQLLIVPGATHRNLLSTAEPWKAIDAFVYGAVPLAN
jgi:alpha-beta hydrolase superfamily lysophospholipase